MWLTKSLLGLLLDFLLNEFIYTSAVLDSQFEDIWVPPFFDDKILDR